MGGGCFRSSTEAVEPRAEAKGPAGSEEQTVPADNGSTTNVETTAVLPEIRPCRTAELLDGATTQEQFQHLLAKKPFLELEIHFLRSYVDRCKQALASGNNESSEEAQDLLENLAMELAHEEQMIAEAFKRFDNEKDHVLKHDEVDFMMDYLGFPNEIDDVKKFIDILDKNDDDAISFDEFVEGVGRLGGCVKLFEVRRQQIEGRIAFKSSEHDKNVLRAKLNECGINEQAQAAWDAVASGSEFDAAATLVHCQKEALRHIRAIAQMNHEAAWPGLLERVKALKYDEKHLLMCLAWIKELSPIIVHVNFDKIAEVLLNDTHYRNQFETNTSSGLLKPTIRTRWEKKLFGPAYDEADPFHRPKYGVQNVWNDHRGVMGCKQYGDSYIVLKDIRLRCTLSPCDSGNLDSKRLAVLDYYAHVLLEYSDKELSEILRISEGGAERVGDSEAVIQNWGKYKEAQIHGEIKLDQHVDRIVLSERHKDESGMIEEVAKKHGWKVKWHSDMKEELEARAGGVEMEQKQFDKMLKSLAQEDKPENQPEKDKVDTAVSLGKLETEARDDKLENQAQQDITENPTEKEKVASE